MDAEQPVTLRGDIEPRDLLAAHLWLVRPPWYRWLLPTLVLLVVAIFSALSAMRTGAPLAWVTEPVGIATLVLLAAWIAWDVWTTRVLFPRRARQAIAQNPDAWRNLRVRLDASGLRVTGANGAQERYAWRDLSSIIESPDAFLVYLDPPVRWGFFSGGFVLMPKRLLSGGADALPRVRALALANGVALRARPSLHARRRKA